MKRHAVTSGIDHVSQADAFLRGRRVGIMTNPTGVDHQLRSTIDLLCARYNVTALFAVEHGIRGDIQAGGKVDNTVDEETGIPVYSAFGKNCHFNEEMLAAFDVLVFDIQDVGARFYTYLYSLSYAMEACCRAGKRMVVLDRINPIGGIKRTGTVLDTRFSSFVGDYELPTQYGMTIGEYACYVKDYLHLSSLELQVVPLQGYTRDLLLDDTDLPWVSPSPNCPTLASALCYIGTCVFEGTNVSEGRGTTIPFQVIGAPWLNGARLEEAMRAQDTPGIVFRRTSFCPTFSKHQGQMCHGVEMHIVDREAADAFAGGLLLLETVREQSGDHFSYTSYGEDGKTLYFLDLLLGTDAFRTGEMDARALTAASRPKVEAFSRSIQRYLIYK